MSLFVRHDKLRNFGLSLFTTQSCRCLTASAHFGLRIAQKIFTEEKSRALRLMSQLSLRHGMARIESSGGAYTRHRPSYTGTRLHLIRPQAIHKAVHLSWTSTLLATETWFIVTTHISIAACTT